MTFTYTDASGQEVCAVVFSCLAGTQYCIAHKILQPTAVIDAATWLDLIQQALTHSRSVGARAVEYRLIEAADSATIAAGLPRLGFVKRHDRIEFRSPLDALPDDTGTPIQWEAVAANGGWSLAQVAAFVWRAKEGDPGFDPTEDPMAYMEDWLADTVLNSGPQYIEVGFLNQEPIALTVAQVNPKTGWSRISDMGLVKSLRGQGLGKWVHRHGFAMMKAQGGMLYHGGTSAMNSPMIRLFEQHGCQEYRRMQEWTYR